MLPSPAVTSFLLKETAVCTITCCTTAQQPPLSPCKVPHQPRGSNHLHQGLSPIALPQQVLPQNFKGSQLVQEDPNQAACSRNQHLQHTNGQAELSHLVAHPCEEFSSTTLKEQNAACDGTKQAPRPAPAGTSSGHSTAPAARTPCTRSTAHHILTQAALLQTCW